MFTWLLNLIRLPSTLRSAHKDHQSWQSMEPIRRFVMLFEQHGVARTQIPRFLDGFGIALTLADINTDQALLNKIDEALLDKACHIFGVRRVDEKGVRALYMTIG